MTLLIFFGGVITGALFTALGGVIWAASVDDEQIRRDLKHEYRESQV